MNTKFTIIIVILLNITINLKGQNIYSTPAGTLAAPAGSATNVGINTGATVVAFPLDVLGDVNVRNAGAIPPNANIGAYRINGITFLYGYGNSSTFVGHRAGTNTAFANLGANSVRDVCVGSDAGVSITGSDNTFVGYSAGFSTTSGIKNTIMGSYAGYWNTGDNNVYIGYGAGNQNASGAGNTFMGYDVGHNSSVSYNTFIGYNAGNANQTGLRNTFMGVSSGVANTTTSDNTATGFHAGKINTGAGNSFFGVYADVSSGGSTNSSAFGFNSTITASSSNASALGHASTASCSDCMVLGNGSSGLSFKVGIGTSNPSGNFHVKDMDGTGGNGSDDIRFEDLPADNALTNVIAWHSSTGRLYTKNNLASSNCTTNNYVPHYSSGSSAYVCGVIQDDGSNVGISTTASNTWTYSGAEALISGGPTSSSTIKLDVNGLLRCATLVVTSDERFKKEIKPLSNSLDKILKLNGVSYNMRKSLSLNSDFEKGKQIGFLAQEVEKILPEAVGKDQDGNYAMNYNMLIPVLTEAIKEQQAQLDAKDEKIAQLENKLNDFEKSLSECCMNVLQSNDNSKTSSTSSNEMAKLEQNNPNPFTDNTSVKYFIPSQSGTAILKIYSLAGVELKSFIISEKGTGQITISGNTFSAGTYVYNLIVDDKQVDSKYMTLTK